MKKSIFITTAIAVLASALFFVSCGAQIDKELYDETVGKKFETTPPGEVKNLKASVFVEAAALQWENPKDDDFYGVTISAIPAFGSLSKPITFISDEPSEIPTVISVNNLQGNVTYTFTVVTFDKNMNYSKGVNVSARPEADSSSFESSFGNSEVFAYKYDKAAFDFGYCKNETTRIIEVVAQSIINPENSYVAKENRTGTGTYEITDVSPKGSVELGEKIQLTVKYTPPASPSWDEMDLIIGGDDSLRLTLLASNFKQPKDIKYFDVETNKELGLQLWLRSDLIGTSDVTDGGLVKRLPDYSGRNLHAYNTDSSKRFLPEYIKSEANSFKGLPFVNFDSNDNTRKAQLLSYGSGKEPIVDSSKGSTTFVVVNTPSVKTGAETTLQTVVSANYGYSYPTLLNTYRYYDSVNGYGPIHNGWAVKGSGLFGTYRYPCTSNSLTDEDNTWFTNAMSVNETSICMWFDQQMSARAKSIGTDGGADYPANIKMWMNGSERLVSYIYSNKETEMATLEKAGTATNYGAYGKPISDGKGHRYGTLSDEQTPSTAQITANDIIYTKWNAARAKNLNRKNDWAFTYSPTDFLFNGTSTRKNQGSGYSLAQTDDGGSSSTYYCYYTNWISQESRRNGTIYSLSLGADNTNATTFRGKIAEVIMFDYPLSDEEINDVNNYIYYRYGIGSPQ